MSKPSIREDKWLKTCCSGCYGTCAIRVHVVDGVVVKIEGDPDSVMGAQGGVCGKASQLIQLLYHPKRLNYPLKRTSSEKGIGIDPKWQRISWDEAVEILTTKMKRIMDDDPRKIIAMWGPTAHGMTPGVSMIPFWSTIGTHIGMCGMGLQCGNASHITAGMNHASWSILPDFEYCNYVLCFGSNKGVGSGHSAGITMRKAAEARARGMKVVAFDPMCNFAGGKATEWIPILPGTDLAVALAMAQVMVNELGVYDREYLKKRTNAPYLVGPDGRYVRDRESGEPLLWDAAEGRAKSWNDPGLRDEALEGAYEVDGIKCQTVFSLVKEHLKQYTPEWAEEISTVPAQTIRRIAGEFAENARIGSTIEIDGVSLPYRPAGIAIFRGAQGHTNGFHTYMAVDILNHLMGNCEVPGGTIGWAVRSLGHPETGNPRFTPYAAKDGFLALSNWLPDVPGSWPHPEPKVPTKSDLTDLFTTVATPAIGMTPDAEDTWRKFGLPPYEVAIGYCCNPVMTAADPDIMIERFKKMFVAMFAVVPNETTESVADIVLPDCTSLEFTNWANGESYFFNYPVGMLDWEYHPYLKVVEPVPERRYAFEVLLELANRLGIRENLNRAYIGYLALSGCPAPFAPEEKFTSWEEMTDKVLKARFGQGRGLEWFKEHGFIRWRKKVEEAYWRPFVNARSSIYPEWLIDHGEEVKAICEAHDFHLDWQQYTPLVSFFPAVIHRDKDPQYDMYAFSYRDILHSASISQEIPWLFELSEMNPFTFNVCMNSHTAREKGIKEGDMVWLENDIQKRIKVRIHTIEGIHPKTIAMICGGGHWLEGNPAKDKGGLLIHLLRSDWDHLCPITQNLETTARVRVYKAEG